MNKDRILGEIRDLREIFWNLIKSEDELSQEIRENSIFGKITQIRIHGIKHHSIWIRIRREIKE